MKQFVKQALIVITVPIIAMTTMAAQGGAGPGGGGFIRGKDGVLKSVPELGLIINRAVEEVFKEKKYPEIYEIPQNVRDELAKILQIIPQLSISKIIDSRGTFLKGSINPSEYEKIKADYVVVAASYGHKLTGDFELAAFSKDYKTYVLTEVAKSLNDRQQAINLIHEYFMRTVNKPNREKLNGIWQIEAALISLLADETPSQVKLLACYQAMESLTGKDFNSSGIKLSIKRQRHREMLAELLQKLGRPVLLSELILEVPDQSEGLFIKINPSLTQKFNSLVPLFAQKTEGATINIVSLDSDLKNSISIHLGKSFDWQTDDYKKYVLKHLEPTFKGLDSIRFKVKAFCEKYPDLKPNPNFSGGDIGDLLIYLEPDTKQISGFGCRNDNTLNSAWYSVNIVD